MFLLVFFQIPINGQTASVLYCKDLDFNLSRFSSAALNSVSFEVTKHYVHIEGQVQAQKLLFLHSSEYQAATKKNEIPVNAILVLDKISLAEDLPLVSAIIINQELLLEATHIQVLAEKIGIPIIYSRGAFIDIKLQQLAKDYQSFELQCKNSQCQISGSNQIFIPKPKMLSVMPKNADRSERKLYSYDVDRFKGRAPRELSGDKYFELMGFKLKFPHLAPDISALSSGYYEKFLNTYETDSHLMRSQFYQLNRALEKANAANDETAVKDLLSTFRQAILSAKPEKSGYDVFDEIVFELESYYHEIYTHNVNTPISIRSNQDVEDLIAAGLYRSTVAQSLTKEHLEENIRKSWASLYDYRAYSIRRYWGQKDHNLSTPLMLHPFVGNILAHSLGTFKMNTKGRLELEVNMVLGENERATNPTATAKVLQFTITENEKGDLQIKTKSSALQSDIEKPILNFLREVRDFIRDEFLLRTYMPTHINIEFVIQKKERLFADSRILILQYKPSLNREVVIDLLNGLLDREETDRKDGNRGLINDTQKLLANLKTQTPSEVIPKLYEELQDQGKSSTPRYALLIKDKKPFLIFWNTSIYHVSMKNSLANSQLKWLKSGYLKLLIKSSSPKPQLVFTETTDYDTDVDLLLNMSQQLFQEALSTALREDPKLYQLLSTEQPEITFHTFEGSDKIRITGAGP
jgi:hypothetical protein